MAIVAASIEANGWVLRLDVSGSLGSFASYTLDPGGTPRVALATSHAGFVKSGGEAVAGTIVRNLIGTKPLRKPANWNGSSLDAAVVDETDLGGGTIRVRIALTEHVYATDTGLSLAVLAGWRTGESAASGISVTNSSTTVAPIPIMRWALQSYQTTTGAFTVSMVVLSHHPVGFEPVAGIKFTATDGTNTRTVWATALGTDNSYGDNLRCYTATIDPATATALTAGLLRIDAEIYPWLGSMRTTDVAGTKSMTTLRTDGWNVDAASPWIIGYDPAGTRYGEQFAFVDPVSGTVTAAAGMVATTLAGAKAVAAASRPRDINTAIQAGYLANRTLPAANGLALSARSVDGMQIVLAAGTHAVGSTGVTTGLTTAEIPIRIIGDPADANPRANCIMPTAATGINRANRVQFQNMTVEIGVNAFGGGVVYAWFNNCEVRGRSGQEASTTAPLTAAPAAGQFSLSLAQTKWWKTAALMSSGSMAPAFVRACEHSRSVGRVLFAAKNRFISGTEDTFVGSTVIAGVYGGWTTATLAGQAEDIIIGWNSLLSTRGSLWTPVRLPAATAGTLNPSIRRTAFIGNVAERIGADVSPFYGLGENTDATMSYNIIEGNSLVGERCNTFYSDPPIKSVTVRGDTGVSGNAIQSTAHGFSNGQQVRYYTTLSAPTIPGLTNGVTYFVVNALANSFQLSLTSGGAALSPTTQASTINGQNFGNITLLDSDLNNAFVNRVANNIFDRVPTKQDTFFESGAAAMRGTGNGYRSQMVEAWSMLYGVGHEGNVLTQRQGGSTFRLEYTGLRSVDGYDGALAPLFTDDNSVLGPDGAGASGGGTYTLEDGSPALGRVLRGQSDVDFAGNVRSAAADAGAFERANALLVGAASRVVSRMAVATLIVSAGGVVLQGLSARVVSRMAEATLGVTAPLVVLVGASARVVARMAAGVLSVAGGGDYIPSTARTRGRGATNTFDVKAADSALDYPIQWELESTESIVDSLWTVSPVEADGMIVEAGSEKIAGAVTACIVSGGVYRRVYELTNTVTTSDGRKYSQTMTFRIGPVERP